MLSEIPTFKIRTISEIVRFLAFTENRTFGFRTFRFQTLTVYHLITHTFLILKHIFFIFVLKCPNYYSLKQVNFRIGGANGQLHFPWLCYCLFGYQTTNVSEKKTKHTKVRILDIYCTLIVDVKKTREFFWYFYSTFCSSKGSLTSEAGCKFLHNFSLA